MLIRDFWYDGIALSDMGYIICSFDKKNIDTKPTVSELKFETIATMNGSKFELVNSKYEDCLGIVIQICKKPCNNSAMEISAGELAELNQWLCRKEFHRFKAITDEYTDIYFEGSFTIEKIEFCDKVYGAELTLTTNRPFGVLEDVVYSFDNTAGNKSFEIIDLSTIEGYIYPKLEITILENGDLSMSNETDNDICIIKNCMADEVITIDYPIISASLETHKIQNDFNWVFPRINNSFRNKKNKYTVTLPCKIKLVYSPAMGVGL